MPNLIEKDLASLRELKVIMKDRGADTQIVDDWVQELTDGNLTVFSDDYQELALRTLAETGSVRITEEQLMKVWKALGLAGEAGEVADTVKKQILHQHGEDPEQIKKELGDLLWYAAVLAKLYGYTLAEVMQGNIEKLQKRYKDGFSVEESIKRVDTREANGS